MHEATIREEMKILCDRLEEKKNDVADKLATDSESKEDKKASEVRLQLVTFFIDACRAEERIDFKGISDWGKEIANYSIEHGGDLSQALEGVSRTRLTIWEEIKKIAIKEEFTVATTFSIVERIDPLLDTAVHSFAAKYIETYKEKIQTAHNNFLTLSAPVVPMVKGAAVLPIVGTIDTERADLLLSTALDQASKQDLSHIFIDLSAVPVIDTLVASNIFKIVESMELVGTHAILAGIRPEVAQTMINLGIDFKSIETYSSLHLAIKKHKELFE
ncbi:hypothetical protein CEY16_11200 [Halalkalibacillus sediminis]|uniref:STAS domain-containing protein n=1 Tax=Halalkalibacillus sediminis TaxID=2018042 RepID=A0A2I0QSJ4_9BACI|nr:STAS domain-containing protein [Halalkalibacillus sediminis]PKR77296.1 hypothetical protein CEY16_11200 [Halalkalibacillus sediminis]